MKMSLGLIARAALPLLALSACVSTQEYDAAVAKGDAAAAQRDSIAAEEAMLRSSYNALQEIFSQEIDNREMEVKQLVDGLEVQIPSDIMFASGSATPSVDDGAREHLVKLADYLKGTDFLITVVGHTDSQQPTPRLAERYPTNWELGSARASVAVRFLQQNGVDPTRIRAVSLAEFEPIADNSTADGRARNRRIQIILRRLPK
jgi:chemotaxis protein MotB